MNRIFAPRVWRQGKLLCALAVLAILATAAPAAHAADRIYWSNLNANSISYANLNGSGGGDLPITGMATVDGPMGLAIDSAAGRFYWSNYGIKAGLGTGTTISVANLDGSGAHNLPITGALVRGPHGVAVDPSAGKIYWTNHDLATKKSWIGYANLDGSGAGILNTAGTTINGPRGLAVDPAAGKIYWANWLNNTISYAKLNGSGGGNIATRNATVQNPEGVALDPPQGRLYFGNFTDDPVRDTISYVNLDGSASGDLAVGAATEDHPHGVTIDLATQKIYWPNFNPNIISFASLNGTGGANLPTPGATKNGPDLPVLLETPRGTGAPRVRGRGAPGSKLRCTQGKWANDLSSLDFNAPQSYSYQWIKGDKAIPGATSSSLKAGPVADYLCQVTGRDAAGQATQISGAYGVFKIGKPRLNRKNGSATLPVVVPGPGKLTLSGKGVVKQRRAREAGAVASRKVRHAGKVKLLVKPKGKAARKLARSGKLRIKVKVTYRPRGGITSARGKKLNLIKR